jgi:predicted heme/steroid binding protein
MKRTPRFVAMACVLFVGLVIWAALPRPKAAATPDYAAKTGQTCATCHVSPQGGGALTATGAAYVRGGYQWPVPAGVTVLTPPTSPLLRLVKAVIGYIHLFTAILWFGTILYIHLLVKPQQLTTGIPKAERKLGWISIVVMAVTGTILTFFRYRDTGAVFTGTWGTVFIIKLVQYGIMVIAAAIATMALDRRMRAPRRPVPAATASGAAGPGPEGITRDALPTFDGREGHKGVVAVKGKLYDVTASRMWREGVHMRKHNAGQDLSEALQGAPHGAEVLQRVPMIGALQAGPAAAPTQPQRWTPHRIFVGLAYLNLALVVGILLCVA